VCYCISFLKTQDGSLSCFAVFHAPYLVCFDPMLPLEIFYGITRMYRPPGLARNNLLLEISKNWKMVEQICRNLPWYIQTCNILTTQTRGYHKLTTKVLQLKRRDQDDLEVDNFTSQFIFNIQQILNFQLFNDCLLKSLSAGAVASC